MRIWVVEDEPLPARRLARMLRELLGNELDQLQTIDDLDDALELLREDPVDLVFLDLNLHGRDGFEMLRRAVAGAFHTVVVSAYTDRALEAFELGVLDFVPKPFTRERLRTALDRARGSTTGSRQVRYLAVRRAGEVHLVPVDDLLYVRAAGDYAELHTMDGGTFLHDKTLARLEVLLPERFQRVHRSYVVDMGRARKLLSEPGSRYSLVLEGGAEVPVSRSRVRDLREAWL